MFINSWRGCCVSYVTGHGPLMHIPFIYLDLLLCFPCYRAWSLNLPSYQPVLASPLSLTSDIWVTIHLIVELTQPWFNRAEICSKNRICIGYSLKTIVCIINIDVTLTPLASKLSKSHVTCANAFLIIYGVISMTMPHMLHEEFLFPHLI